MADTSRIREFLQTLMFGFALRGIHSFSKALVIRFSKKALVIIRLPLPSSSYMNISVILVPRTLEDSAVTLTLKVSSESTGLDIAEKVHCQSLSLRIADQVYCAMHLRGTGSTAMGFPPFQQDIRCKNGRLYFNETLAEHNIKEHSTLYVFVRENAGVMNRGYVVKDWDTLKGPPKHITPKVYYFREHWFLFFMRKSCLKLPILIVGSEEQGKT